MAVDVLEKAFRDLSQALGESPAEKLPGALAELERLRAEAWLRLRLPEPAANGDTLLTAAEAAERLRIPVTTLYRRRWPFRVELSEGTIRYSEQKLDRFIASKAGR